MWCGGVVGGVVWCGVAWCGVVNALARVGEYTQGEMVEYTENAHVGVDALMTLWRMNTSITVTIKRPPKKGSEPPTKVVGSNKAHPPT